MPKLRKISQEDFDNTPEPEGAGDINELEEEYGATAELLSHERYPHLAAWIFERGWVEFGADEYSSSLVRILDIGGLVWESEGPYDSFDEALADADAALAELEDAGEL